MAEMLVSIGWWPEDVEFDFSDLATVSAILETRRRSQR